jgi:hypothetical protein
MAHVTPEKNVDVKILELSVGACKDVTWNIPTCSNTDWYEEGRVKPVLSYGSVEGMNGAYDVVECRASSVLIPLAGVVVVDVREIRSCPVT